MCRVIRRYGAVAALAIAPVLSLAQTTTNLAQLQQLQQQIERKVDFETFFAEAPQMNPNASRITGVICGYRIEDIEDQLMRRIRYLDKLVDELARGKAMDKILRK